MREIKFRVYTEVSHEWLGMKYLELKDVSTNYNNTLMQYTGLKDKNGKEIYEGDIILCASPKHCPHEIKWFERVPSDNFMGSGMPGFYLTNMNSGYDFIGEEEVIGNKFENPELLKEEE